MKRLLTFLILLVVGVAYALLYLARCQPKPPIITPTATITYTLAPTSTNTPTATITQPPPSLTPTASPATITASPTATQAEPTITATQAEPVATIDYCWYNWFAGVVCYPRLHWHPKPSSRFLRRL